MQLTLKQMQINDDDEHRYLHALGDPRSGKSVGFFLKARKYLLMYPGINGLITRDTGTSILMFTFPEFLKILEPRAILGDPRMKPYPFITLKNGSTLSFIPYDEVDITKAGGSEYGFILVDEATRFSRSQYEYFDTRLSQSVGNGIRRDKKRIKTIIPHRWIGTTANPAGRGWTWKLFSTEHPLSYLNGDPAYRAWKFFIEDNEHNLPKDYVKAMREKPEHIRRKILGANEDPMGGLVFSEFSRELNVCKIRNFIPRPYWKIYIGMDHGYKTPTVVLWMAVTEEGFLIFFHEYRQSNKTIAENVESILSENNKLFNAGMAWPLSGRIDPSTTQEDGKSGSVKTTYKLYWEAGMSKLSLYPAKRQKVYDRVERMRDLLKPDPNKQKHPITGEFREGGWPTVIFTEDCDGDQDMNIRGVEGGTITEFEEWEIKETNNSKKNISEMPEEKNDHGPDAACYVVQIYYGENAPEDPNVTAQREANPQEILKKSIFERLERHIAPKAISTSSLQGADY